MRIKRRIGKRGGLASALIDIYSIFFYIFVLLLFIILFSLHRGCSSSATELSLTSDVNKTIEARVMLLSLLRTPVELPDGRIADIGELIALHELPSEDFEGVLEEEVTKIIEGYLEQVIMDYMEEDFEGSAKNSWELNIDYRSESKTLRIGKLTGIGGFLEFIHGDSFGDYYDEVEATMLIPLVYDSSESSQTALVTLVVHAGLLGLQGGVY